MTDISFYQLTTTPREKTIPRLLEKAYEQGKRAVVLCDSEEALKNYNSSLWTYAQSAFLPHGYLGDPQDQPIWLSQTADNVNGASVLVITTGQEVPNLSDYERCVDIFDGNIPDELEAANKRRETYKAAGHTVNFWQQTPQGAWVAA